jgi:diguanylate cyclase (GGDEF)-like protein
MRIRIRNKRQMWLFIAAVTIISVITTEMTLLLVYLSMGDAAFGKENAFLTALIVPILVAVPVCYMTARMALQLSNAHARLKELAHTDELTGLINRRSFFESAEAMLDQAQDDGTILSLLVIDADYFKQLNDTYGHATGDAALQFITEQLNSSVRKSDLVCRLGGEEFAVLLPGLKEIEAEKLGTRILERISSRPMFWDEKIIEMSVSCGVADTRIGYDMTTLFKAADDALYAAKTSGRNRQVVFSKMEGVRQAASSPSARAANHS